MADEKRMTFRIESTEFIQNLDHAALRSGTTSAEVIRKALNLFLICQENVLAGGQVFLKDKDRIETEIVGFTGSPKLRLIR